MDFKAPQELQNPLSKAVPGKVGESDGQNKNNCLQDWSNVHQGWAWQIVSIFNTIQLYAINPDYMRHTNIYRTIETEQYYISVINIVMLITVLIKYFDITDKEIPLWGWDGHGIISFH